MRLFLGDSFTSADNCNKTGFTTFIKNTETNINLAVSGTCIGNYSPYPVDGYNLLDILIQNATLIKKANSIFIEYGINDTSALCLKIVSIEQVKISLIKAIDYISQLNKNCKIYFLVLDKTILKDYAKNQCDYLKMYTHKLIHWKTWKKWYNKIVNIADEFCTTIVMLDTLQYMDKNDVLHPSIEGYKRIATILNKYI